MRLLAQEHQTQRRITPYTDREKTTVEGPDHRVIFALHPRSAIDDHVVMRLTVPLHQGACACGGDCPRCLSEHRVPETPIGSVRSIPASFSSRDFLVQGQLGPPTDELHGPLLDQFSRETGLPRDTVTQHDPAYEAWILGRPPVPPAINITLDLRVPATPAPDYSQDEGQLGAWERANFRFTARRFQLCDHVINNGIESSFLTDIGFEMVRPTLEYFIARHIFENMNDRGRPVGERITWSQIHSRIRQHAGTHFVRFRQVVDSMRETIRQRFAALPTRNSPIRIPQRDLETYVDSLLQYLEARLHFELWRTTCDWEHADYPNLLRGIPNVGGRFVPACDPRPIVPPEPIMPIVVTPGTPGVRSPTRRTRP